MRSLKSTQTNYKYQDPFWTPRRQKIKKIIESYVYGSDLGIKQIILLIELAFKEEDR